MSLSLRILFLYLIHLCTGSISQFLNGVVFEVSEGDGEDLHGTDGSTVGSGDHCTSTKSLKSNSQNFTKKMLKNLVVVKQHFEFIKIKPPLSLPLLEIMIEVTSCKPK